MPSKTMKTIDEMTLWQPKAGITPARAASAVCSFLDTATTSMGRATHYNSRQEQQNAELQAHADLMTMSRDLYTVLLALPGVTDRSVQVGMKKLLSTHRNGNDEFLTPAMERAVLYHLIQALPVPRMMRLMDAFRFGNPQLGISRANNARTRKLVLRTLLGSPRLPLWSVKYRTKVESSLTHAWGKRLTSILREVLRKDGRTLTAKEREILTKNIDGFAMQPLGARENMKRAKQARECVAFVLGARSRLSLPLLKAFEAAKTDLKKGSKLPLEVLEGIRSTYHSNVNREEVLKIVAKGGRMTDHQKKVVQKRAKAANIEVKMDPTRYEAVDLYLYAFEMGLDGDITKALESKAKKAAEAFPARYRDVGIVVDASASMKGHKTQPLRPMAASLAMRDMLHHVGDRHNTVYVGGEMGDLVHPMGDTALADSLIEVLECTPDVVFVLSDGYENAPAGRFSEVVEQVREIGVQTPIYHLNPVFAAERGGVRELASGLVPTMPVKSPTGLGTTMLRGLIEAEPVRGINSLVRMALTSGPVEMKFLAEK